MNGRRNDEWLKAGIEIGEEVDTARIADDVVIHSGCRIRGAETSIGPGCVVGGEAPATVENCQLGRKVELKGGLFSGAVFFDGANMGSGAHVRAGTILEEEAGCAHAVGLKQTVLLPFVTLGSLINFCDILMAGGTSRRNHSEVGSSYVHFNYTPHQDKATPSLLGDVPRGVFLDRKPIFLGGQGGLVGPARMAYGTVVAAGGICRQDILEEDQLHVAPAPEPGTHPYNAGAYRDIDRIVKNNLLYIGNIIALKAWYCNVRKRFMCRDRFDQACLDGGMKNIDLVLEERIKRLGDLAGKMEYSLRQLSRSGSVASGKSIAAQQRFENAWENMELELRKTGWTGSAVVRDTFLGAVDRMPVGDSYVESVRSMEPGIRQAGQQWLQSIVDSVAALWPGDWVLSKNL